MPMTYVERLENVTVLGAAGKMGSGIVLLTALEMADLSLEPGNRIAKLRSPRRRRLAPRPWRDLLKYLRDQVLRSAEKKAVWLRKRLRQTRADLVENEEIIDQYVEDVLAIVRPTTRDRGRRSTPPWSSKRSTKTRTSRSSSSPGSTAGTRGSAWFFTNTSSIPISEIERPGRSSDGRLIGFHFYNPPAVQKLVEIIPARIHPSRAGGVRRAIRQEAAEDRRPFQRRRRVHRQRPLHEGRPVRHLRGRTAGRGVRLRQRRSTWSTRSARIS